MKASPCFQFYPDDFVGGSPGLMEPDDTHVYVWLMCLEWNQNGFIFEEKTLGKWCRISRARFRRSWEKVRHLFVEREGKWYHPRLDKERQKQQLWREKSADGGKKSAAKRPRVVQPPSNHPTKGGATLQLSVPSPASELPPSGAGANGAPPTNSSAKRAKLPRPPAVFMGRVKPLWRKHYGADPPSGTATELAKVVREVGEDEMLVRLDRYASLTPAAFINMPKFAGTHGSYTATSPPANARARVAPPPTPEDEVARNKALGARVDARRRELDGEEWWSWVERAAKLNGAVTHRDVLQFAEKHLEDTYAET